MPITQSNLNESSLTELGSYHFKKVYLATDQIGLLIIDESPNWLLSSGPTLYVPLSASKAAKIVAQTLDLRQAINEAAELYLVDTNRKSTKVTIGELNPDALPSLGAWAPVSPTARPAQSPNGATPN